MFRAFLRICQRPWWTRLWTIQEVALADKAVFYVGQHHASLVTLSDAIGGWSETYGMVQGDMSVREEHYVAASHAYRVIHGLIMFFRDDSECCARQRFLQHLLLPSCDNISTTVPADIVYATRKLTLAWKEPSLDPTRRLKDSDLWKEVTLSLLADREIATLPAATILALVGTQHPSHTFPTQPYRDPSLPSWVCDIKACIAEAWRKFAFYRPDTHKPCAGGPDPQMDIAYSGEQLDMLCVCGHRWSRIHHILESSQRFSEVYVSGYFEKPQVEEELRKYVLPWYLRCRRYAFRQRTVYEDLNATFVELLSHGRLFDTSLVRHEEERKCKQRLRTSTDPGRFTCELTWIWTRSSQNWRHSSMRNSKGGLSTVVAFWHTQRLAIWPGYLRSHSRETGCACSMVLHIPSFSEMRRGRRVVSA